MGALTKKNTVLRPLDLGNLIIDLNDVRAVSSRSRGVRPDALYAVVFHMASTEDIEIKLSTQEEVDAVMAVVRLMLGAVTLKDIITQAEAISEE